MYLLRNGIEQRMSCFVPDLNFEALVAYLMNTSPPQSSMLKQQHKKG